MEENKDQDKKLADSLDFALELRARYRHKAFMMMLEIFVIFGVPAAFGFWFGQYISVHYFDGTKGVRIAILAATFILSWIIMIVRYKQIDRKLKEANKRVQEIKNKNT